MTHGTCGRLPTEAKAWPSALKPGSHFIIKGALSCTIAHFIWQTGCYTSKRNSKMVLILQRSCTRILNETLKQRYQLEHRQKHWAHQSRLGLDSQPVNSKREACGSTASSPDRLSLTNEDRKTWERSIKWAGPQEQEPGHAATQK